MTDRKEQLRAAARARLLTDEQEVVRVELDKLKKRYQDGLISRSEAIEMRAELLKRLDI